MTFRCAFSIRDELHSLAAHFAHAYDHSLNEVRSVDGAKVISVYRDGSYQVELCVISPGLVIPAHTHPHADTIEIGYSGYVRLSVNGLDPFSVISDARMPIFTKGRGIRINHMDVHGGAAGANGAAFLSVQRWVGPVRSVLTDYAGEPLGRQHAELLGC